MIPSAEDRAVTHIDRISEDQGGYFPSRDGLRLDLPRAPI
jgi:hypothetical protein